MPTGWKDHAWIAGIIQRAPRKAPTSRADFAVSRIGYGLAIWEGPGNRMHSVQLSHADLGQSGETTALLPYVFGKRPVRFLVTVPGFDGNNLDLELPPLGFPAPKIEPLNARVGGATLNLEPIEWIGPCFGARYRATVTGLRPGESILISNIVTPFAPTLGKRFGISIGSEVTAVKPVEIHVASGDFDLRVMVVKKEVLDAVAASVPTSTPARKLLVLRSTGGEMIARGEWNRDGSVWFDPKEPVEVQGTWIGPPFDLDRTLGLLEPPWLTFADGETVKANVYRIQSSKTMRISELVPDPRKFLPGKPPQADFKLENSRDE